MKRFAVLLLLLIALCLTGCGTGGDGWAKDKNSPVISEVIITPTIVSSGGIINGTATIDDDSSLSYVRLVIMGTGIQSLLIDTGSGVYSGALTIPDYLAAGSYQVIVEAEDLSGNISQSTPVLITVEGSQAESSAK